MGLNIFGSSKGDSSTTNDNRQDNSTTIQEGDLSGGSIRAGGNVTVTDQGAVEKAFEFGDRAFDFGDRAFDFGGASLVESYKFGGKALDTVADNAAETYNAIAENNRRSYDVIERATNPGAAAEQTGQKYMIGLVILAGLAIWSARA